MGGSGKEFTIERKMPNFNAMNKNQESDSENLMDRLLRKIQDNESLDDLAIGWLRYRAIDHLSREEPEALIGRLQYGETVEDIVLDCLSHWLEHGQDYELGHSTPSRD